MNLRNITVAAGLTAIMALPGLHAQSQGSKMTQELVHVGQAMVQVSGVLLLNLKAHQGERSVGTYASRIASANLALVKQMRAPKEAKTLHKHLLEMANNFSKAVNAYNKGDYKTSNDYGADVMETAGKVKRELNSLGRKGVIPRARP
ncbi:MAG: hypothetical protein QF437_17880 [Planctomycetota bacterium]|nr:hypothetical protein [Planctomycetota bacterium]MDP7132368.1 hypothetical protein [Planctomycetota bacterium]MDP7252105.1 hypothetical protein [Planctomycetota bacterium]